MAVAIRSAAAWIVREQNRDGADTNRSFNHGAEGPTDDERVLATRRTAMRNLMGTLLLSAGCR